MFTSADTNCINKNNIMCSINKLASPEVRSKNDARSHSAQGLVSSVTNSAIKIPLPPRLWITDVSDNSSDEVDSHLKEDSGTMERVRVRSRFRHHKQKTISIPIGIFWDIENCQVPRGCSAIDVVAAIRAKFLNGRREADFVVVCDVRKEAALRLQELNDAQVNLIHVCGTQKNAADEKLRQCMRRFGELHTAPAALLLVSGDINFAADLCDFKHRKNMEVILVHKKNTSSALIKCASSHYCYSELTANLPRNPKTLSLNEDEEDPTCELEVGNLPMDQPPERVSKRLKRLSDNCGGKVLNVTAPTALLRFPTLDQAGRALKRMEGEDVFGRKISTRYRRSAPAAPAYSSDEGYSTAPPAPPALPALPALPTPVVSTSTSQPNDYNQQLPADSAEARPSVNVSREWALALQQLPAPEPLPVEYHPPAAPRPRQIRGTHGYVNLDRSGCSSSNSLDENRQRENSQSRAISPWNSSASFSEHSEGDLEANVEVTVSNLPPQDDANLHEMLVTLFSQYVPVVRVTVWANTDGPLGTVVLRSVWDARLAIARIHKRRLENRWVGRRLELSLGRPSPGTALDVLRARLRTILLDQTGFMMPLLRLRDSYASRYCCALTTSDLMKIWDTVIIHEGFGRLVQLVDLRPVSSEEAQEAPWKCYLHASLGAGLEDGTRILQPVYMEISTLAVNTKSLIDSHGGMIPLLTFVECYESVFGPLPLDPQRGVALELLLRSVSGVALRDDPSRHLVRALPEQAIRVRAASESSRWSSEGYRTAPALEPMLALFERELVELLRSAPRCTIQFSKLIPAFHHYFGRQCRVADYGFTKLPDLLAVLSNTIVVLGSGSSRVITMSPAAQTRRWSSDLVKLLNAQPGRNMMPHEIPQAYEATFKQLFSPANYGVCTVAELMRRASPVTVLPAPAAARAMSHPAPVGDLALLPPAQTADGRALIAHFAAQVVELLCHTPNLRIEFSQFVPQYHAHFQHQLRVAHYGCASLVELLEKIPDAVSVRYEPSGERGVRLTRAGTRAVLGQRLRALGSVPVGEFPARYAQLYGAPPLPDMLEAESPAALVLATGGSVQGGVTSPPGAAPRWVSAELAACGALAADRSVGARGSSVEYLCAALRRAGAEAAVLELAAAGVLRLSDRHVRLTPQWRAVWRLALILADRPLLTLMDIFMEYNRRFEPTFPCADLGFGSLLEFLRYYHEVFVEDSDRWSLCAGVVVTHTNELTPVQENYSVHDTPPGQKGSSVFDSPKSNVWCSPPASALPAPSALLALEKRRVRLAAQFDAMQCTSQDS